MALLDDILKLKKKEILSKLEAITLVQKLLKKLNKRERDVIVKRFGLKEKKRQTLAAIGKKLNLTRERIRQIENFSLQKIRKNKDMEEIEAMASLIKEILEEHGGLMSKDYLMELLIDIFNDYHEDKKDKDVLINNFLFLISNILDHELEKVKGSKYFDSYFRPKDKDTSHLEEIVEELEGEIKKNDEPKSTEDILKIIKDLKKSQDYQEKIKVNQDVDTAYFLNKKDNIFIEDENLINQNKTFYNLLRSAKNIDQNKFGEWGDKKSWKINPKRLGEKAYLILRNYDYPMHYLDVANLINSLGFNKKDANSASVHNELIMNDNYKLMSRGKYGLIEWDDNKDNICDFVVNFLKDKPDGALFSDIYDYIISNRDVKKNNICFVLANRNIFRREGDRFFLDI